MKRYLCAVMSALLVGGCGELSYKRGASTQDLEAAKQACTAGRRDQSTEQCLAAQGWTVKQLDDVDLFATAAVSPDNRTPGAYVVPAWVPVTPAAPASTSAPASSGAASPPAAPTAAAVPAAVSAPATAPTIASTAASPAAAPSPLDVYTISSWWKIGADREALAADTQTCVTELGAPHKPNAATQQVTRGFVVCMHDKGWKALRAVAS